MGSPIESAPKINPEIDENGYIKLKAEEWSRLMAYLDRMTKFIYQNFD